MLMTLSFSGTATLFRACREEIYKLVPTHARPGRGAFPLWKKLFIRQNREFNLDHKTLIDPWLPKIQALPPSLQKLE